MIFAHSGSFCCERNLLADTLPLLLYSFFFCTDARMAKSKNHTANNQSRKNHRNFKKAPRVKIVSKKGQDSKMVRNSRFALRLSEKTPS